MKKTIIIIVIALVVVGGGVLFFIYGGGETSTGSSNSPQTPQANGPAAVSNNFANVPKDQELLNNMRAAGLDPLSSEGTVMHIHQHLDIVVNNQPMPIPAEIGVGSNFISAIHTHDTTGIVHVESPVKKDFTLNQFFQEWGIAFNNNCIANNCSDATHKLVVAINGSSVGDVSNLVLKSHDEIEIWYGDKAATPQLIPSYTFPDGY